jgi:hypothetical protein
MARIVVCALFEGACVTVAALSSPYDASTLSSHIMAWRVCLPALCVALAALFTFFAVMEPGYRRSFFVRDTRLAMNRRHWAAWVEGVHGDADRAEKVGGGAFLRYVGEPVVVWVEQCAACWALSPPVWCSAEWREAVLGHAHLLPGDGEARVAAAMSRIAGSDVDGDGTRDEAGGSGGPAAAQAREEWDLSSPLVV